MSSIISKLINLAGNITGVLPVLNGGTGVTTSTGSGSNALSTSPTFVTPILGTPTSGTLSGCTTLGGITSGTAVASGIIGQVIQSTAQGGSTTVTASPTNLASVPLTAGVWIITASINCVIALAATNHVTYAVGTTTASFTGCVVGYTQFQLYTLAASGICSGAFTFYVNNSGAQTYYLNAQSDQGNASSGNIIGSLIAVRVG